MTSTLGVRGDDPIHRRGRLVVAPGDAELLVALAQRLSAVGLECHVEPGDEGLPDQLLIRLSQNERGQSLELQMLFLGDLTDPSVLQYYVRLPTRARVGSTANVTRFLNGANAALPIGSFGMVEEEGILYFRANIPVVVDPLDVHLVDWTVKMIDYIVGSLANLIEQLAMGLEYDLARRLLDETLAHLMDS